MTILRKILKVLWKTLKYSFIVLLVLGIALFIALQTSAVQTFLAQKASDYLSTELNTKVSIGKVDIDFFANANLRDVYVEDLHQDTLIYGGNINCKISGFSFKEKKMKLEEVTLENINAKLITYKGDSTLNMQFLLDYFSPKSSTPKDTSAGFEVKYGALVMNNVNFTYKDLNDTSKSRGMNFSDLAFRKVNGKISDIKFEGDTIFANLDHLSVKEKCGLNLKNLTTIAKVSPAGIYLDSLTLQTDNSYLHGSYSMKHDSYDDYNDYINKVYMKANLLDSTHINAKDIAYFVPDFIGLNNNIKLSGKVKGTVNDLTGTKINLAYGTNTKYEGDFGLVDVTDSKNMYIHFKVKNLQTSAKDLATIPVPPFDKNKKLELPKKVYDLGTINFKGNVDGFINDLAAKGTLNTALGSIYADVGVSNINVDGKELAYHGKVKTSSLNVGKLLDMPELGIVSIETNINGSGTDLKSLDSKIEGDLKEFTYNNYTYRNIKLTGNIAHKVFHGKMEMRDANADLDFYGDVDFNDKVPDMDFVATVNKFDIAKTHFLKGDSSAILSSQILIKLKGDGIDNLTGQVNFDNTNFAYRERMYTISTFNLLMEQESLEKSIKLNSNVFDLKINGDFRLSSIQNSFNQYMNNYFPTFIKQDKLVENKYNDKFDFKLKVKKFSLINNLISPDLSISSNTIIDGHFDASKNDLMINGKSDRIKYKDFVAKNWYLNTSSVTNGIELKTGLDKFNITDSLYVGNFQLSALNFDKNSTFNISWDNKARQKYDGNISGNVAFEPKGIEIGIDKFGVHIADSLWLLANKDVIELDSSGNVNFNELEFSNNNQLVKIAGKLSKDPSEQIQIALNNFKLQQVNPVIENAKLKLSGTVSGTTNLNDVFDKLIFASGLEFSDLKINNQLLGHKGEINSYYVKSKDEVQINGYFQKRFRSGATSDDIKFEGFYYPSKKEDNVDIKLMVSALNMQILQPYLVDIISIEEGFVSGNATMKGTFNKPLISGELSFSKLISKVDYTNCRYVINGKIALQPDMIGLEDFLLFDEKGNTATLSGQIFHDNFSISKIDLDINPNKFQCLNTNAIQNPTYYGKAYATGNVGIYGSLDQLNILVNAKTEKNTQFNIPLSGPAEIEEKGFIRFVKADTLGTKNVVDKDLSGLNLNFNLEATPEAEVQLIFDEKAGDVIKARGRGNINMNISSSGNFEMYGLYNITDGSYLFTLENFINKKFDIENGSTILWSGNPYNAEIDITANYKQRTALSPFFPEDSTGQYKKRTVAECKLFMRHQLLTPEITFGIGLPMVDETTKQTIFSLVNNEQELNRQVFSLLLLKSFVTPLSKANAAGVNYGAAGAATASEMLSNQISNWLSQLSTNVDIGVNYRPGNQLSNEELELALSKQLFNDKVTIDGNIGVNNNSQNKTSSMIGDLAVDYKVTNEGKVHLKAFNRSNDNTQIATQGGPFTQGVGIFYREEFNTIDELYRRYLDKLKGKKKKTT